MELQDVATVPSRLAYNWHTISKINKSLNGDFKMDFGIPILG